MTIISAAIISGLTAAAFSWYLSRLYHEYRLQTDIAGRLRRIYRPDFYVPSGPLLELSPEQDGHDDLPPRQPLPIREANVRRHESRRGDILAPIPRRWRVSNS